MAVACRLTSHFVRSKRDLTGLLPLTAKAVTNIATYDIDRIDLFLSRFAKLQDFLTTKLFRSLARAALEGVDQDVSVFDTLTRMEKFGVISSLEEWVTLRQLRNSFSHEYLVNEKEIADNINRAYAGAEVLLATLVQVHRFGVAHLGLDLLPCPVGDEEREKGTES
ncbi:conserved hypothetical protein [Gammaproteobacteria bacterium]